VTIDGLPEQSIYEISHVNRLDISYFLHGLDPQRSLQTPSSVTSVINPLHPDDNIKLF
jgi:hypothetical protein